MKVLQVVAADRWTGAAATVLQLVEALRAKGHDCELAFRPGRGLEERLRGCDWAHAVLPKERSLAGIRRNVSVVRELAHGCSIVHCHLPHDHVLTRLALRSPHLASRDPRHRGDIQRSDTHDAPRSRPHPVRGVHAPRHLSPHLLHRWLFRTTAALSLVNSSMVPLARRIRGLDHVPVQVLPVALEAGFKPGGDRGGARQRLGIPADAFVVGTVGKLDEGRGHDAFLRGVAGTPRAWALLIGKGPAVPRLRALAGELGLADRLAMPGYVETGLEDLYAAMDVFVFPAAGADHAHRAIVEAAGCGLASLAVDVPGVRDLVEPGVTGDLWMAGHWEALASALASWASDLERCRRAGAAAAARAQTLWTPLALASAALDLYGRITPTAPLQPEPDPAGRGPSWPP